MAADSIVGEARHAVPHDRIAGQRIIGAGQMTAEPRDFPNAKRHCVRLLVEQRSSTVVADCGGYERGLTGVR